jgi:hypothetical protein
MHKNIKILHEDSDLQVSIIEKEDSEFVTLAFASADLQYHGMDLLKPEFIKSSKFATTIFIVDKTLSFGNNVDFNLLQKIIFPHTKDKKINAVGSSMGAYNAIIASNFIDISTIVAFVPMFSPSPKVILGENRWYRFMDKVRTLHFESLENQFNNKSQYYIIAGFSGADRKQLCKMPKKSNIHKIYFKNPYFHHDVARILNEQKILYNVIESCYNGEPAEQIIQQHLNVEIYQCYSPGDNIND